MFNKPRTCSSDWSATRTTQERHPSVPLVSLSSWEVLSVPVQHRKSSWETTSVSKYNDMAIVARPQTPLRDFLLHCECIFRQACYYRDVNSDTESHKTNTIERQPPRRPPPTKPLKSELIWGEIILYVLPVHQCRSGRRDLDLADGSPRRPIKR